MFNATVDMHAPLREKRVKNPNQPDWFNDVIRQEILKRDLFLKSGNTLAYRKQRNFVVSLINSTKEGSFHRTFIKCKGNSGKLWQASILHKGKTISDPVVIADFLTAILSMLQILCWNIFLINLIMFLYLNLTRLSSQNYHLIPSFLYL